MRGVNWGCIGRAPGGGRRGWDEWVWGIDGMTTIRDWHLPDPDPYERLCRFCEFAGPRAVLAK